MRHDDIPESEPQTENEATFTAAPAGLFSLSNAFRVAAVLSVVAGVYLFFQALQYVSIVGSAAYEGGILRLGIALVVALFLLLGEKLCRYLDADQ